MRKIVVSTFLSLDGVMQAPGGPGEDPAGCRLWAATNDYSVWRRCWPLRAA